MVNIYINIRGFSNLMMAKVSWGFDVNDGW
jgi:hypothetical protein